MFSSDMENYFVMLTILLHLLHESDSNNSSNQVLSIKLAIIVNWVCVQQSRRWYYSIRRPYSDEVLISL